MSWMDSWSRPAKSQATPAPYYLLPGGEATPYCHACGRVIGQRKQVQSQLNQHDKTNGTEAAEKGTGTGVKYCSARCRGRKVGKLDREIEGVFVRFLLGKETMGKDKDDGDEATGGPTEAGEEGGGDTATKDFGWSEDKPKKSTKGAKHHQQKGNNKKIKGDARILVSCSMVEDEMFAHHRGEQGDDEDAEEERPGTSSSQEHDDDHDDHHEQHHHHHHHQQSEKQPETDDELVPYNDPDLYSDALQPPSHQKEDEEIDGDVLARLSIRSGTRIRPAQSVSQVNGSVGGEKGRAERTEETEASLQKRIAGQRRAREREMVRCAARRGVAFGFVIPEEDIEDHHDEERGGGGKTKKGGGKKHSKKASGSGKHGHDGGEGGDKGDDTKNRRKFCEAVMSGKVVEPSFAKGNWSIRWREE
ncbi:hypothetical protein PG996_006462 [Apiospora saccharicola]|uniref:C2H2-type domain-containing protein n=1 Tax=Apiospora saccharicola TaxID=335842 RepID=A0ABR1VTB2_9PEZI